MENTGKDEKEQNQELQRRREKLNVRSECAAESNKLVKSINKDEKAHDKG